MGVIPLQRCSRCKLVRDVVDQVETLKGLEIVKLHTVLKEEETKEKRKLFVLYSWNFERSLDVRERHS